MNSSLSLGRIAGVRVGLNWSVLIVAGLYVLLLATEQLPGAYPGLSTFAYWSAGVIGALLFFGSLLGHEMGHALAARRENMGVTGVTLWLLGGFTEFTEEPPTPGKMFRIAIAGPVVNGLLAVAFWGIHSGLGGSNAFDAGQGTIGLWAGVAGWLAVINALLAVLNLLPAAPLDGGQVLTAGLWAARNDRSEARSWSAVAGLALGGILIGIGLLQITADSSFEGAWLIIVGWWILGTARGQYAAATADRVFNRVTLGEVMRPDPPMLPEWITVDHAISGLPPGTPHRAFPVQSSDGRITGMLTVEQLAALDPLHRSTLLVSQVAFPLSRLTWGTTDAPLLPAIRQLSASGVPAMLVLWPDQRVAGVIGEQELSLAFSKGRRGSHAIR